VQAGVNAFQFNLTASSQFVFYKPASLNFTVSNKALKVVLYIAGGASSGQNINVLLFNYNKMTKAFTYTFSTDSLTVAAMTTSGTIKNVYQQATCTFSTHFPAGNYDGFLLRSAGAQSTVYVDTVTLYQ